MEGWSGPATIAPDGGRWRVLAHTADYQAGLCYYPAGIEHPDHEHRRGQLSFLLAGGFAESAEGKDAEPMGSQFRFQAEGARHRCRYGSDGALILSVNYFEGRRSRIDHMGWHRALPVLGEHYRMLFARADRPELIIDDLIASIVGRGDCEVSPYRQAPRWLRIAAEEMADNPLVEIADVAKRAGVHRVHFSREFQRHFGLSPTHYRLQAKHARACRLLVERGEDPAQAALGAGFADQAHWTRASKALAGLPPGRLRTLLAA